MVSVCILLCNYNHERYLRTALDGIFGQSRPADQIVIVDDGSTDNSPAIIAEYLPRHPNVTFIDRRENRGLMASVAEALEHVRTDYMVWSASDDRLLPDFLEKEMALVERHPDAAFCFSETAVFDSDFRQWRRVAELPGHAGHDISTLPEYLSPAQILDVLRSRWLPISSNTVVVRTQLVRELGGFPPVLRWYADSFVYMTLALRHGVCLVPETLATIRTEPSGYSMARNQAARQVAVLKALLDTLAAPCHADIREAAKAAPGWFAPYDLIMFRVMAGRPRDWDLMVRYLAWHWRNFRRRNPLPLHKTALLFLGRCALRLVAGPKSVRDNHPGDIPGPSASRGPHGPRR